ncbi:MAG: ATP-binding cassette domain-containing protein [Actinomycetota bacterium]|nr:ATP-binding cassette domain-containing protein [Actinomycetota bacterium]
MSAIETRALAKDYRVGFWRPRPYRALHDLTLTVEAGEVFGFLGPNGAGKTTTLRILLGLVRATSGTATISGKPYAALPEPTRFVGAALEAASFHPGRTARNHLLSLAPQARATERNVDEVLDLVGLSDAAKRRVGGFSLGMRQRLGLATTLLGDPRVLVLDEPANGLDPEGIAWLRSLLRHLAHEGRTVLVSSHVLAEVQQTVDDVVIISRGRLAHASTLSELAALAAPVVIVGSPSTDRLERLVTEQGWRRSHAPAGAATTPGAIALEQVTPAQVGAAAFAAGLELHELALHNPGLEKLFLDLTSAHAFDAGAASRGGAA